MELIGVLILFILLGATFFFVGRTAELEEKFNNP